LNELTKDLKGRNLHLASTGKLNVHEAFIQLLENNFNQQYQKNQYTQLINMSALYLIYSSIITSQGHLINQPAGSLWPFLIYLLIYKSTHTVPDIKTPQNNTSTLHSMFSLVFNTKTDQDVCCLHCKQKIDFEII